MKPCIPMIKCKLMCIRISFEKFLYRIWGRPFTCLSKEKENVKFCKQNIIEKSEAVIIIAYTFIQNRRSRFHIFLICV